MGFCRGWFGFLAVEARACIEEVVEGGNTWDPGGKTLTRFPVNT
jgi:hypothetical protein